MQVRVNTTASTLQYIYTYRCIPVTCNSWRFRSTSTTYRTTEPRRPRKKRVTCAGVADGTAHTYTDAPRRTVTAPRRSAGGALASMDHSGPSDASGRPDGAVAATAQGWSVTALSSVLRRPRGARRRRRGSCPIRPERWRSRPISPGTARDVRGGPDRRRDAGAQRARCRSTSCACVRDGHGDHAARPRMACASEDRDADDALRPARCWTTRRRTPRITLDRTIVRDAPPEGRGARRDRRRWRRRSPRR